MTTGIQADPAPNLSSATYQSEDDDPRTSDESEPELEYGSSSDDGWFDRHHARFRDFPWTSANHWPRLPAELKSIILKQLSVKDLKKVAEAAPHLAHEELRLRVKTLSIRAHLRISALIDMLRDTGTTATAHLAKEKLYPCRAGTGWLKTPDFHSSFVAPSAIHAFYQLRHNDNGYVVSVVRSRSSCSIAPILGYHSTIMMNWISWDGVSCMYPALTFDYKGLTTALSFNYVISDRVPQPPALLPQPAQALSHSEWQEREINDWARTEVAAYPVNVSWKLAMRFLGQEAGDMLGFGQNADRAWIRVQGERQYSQYSVLKDPNVQEASTDVDLNEFS
ncbi:hypothetical protein BKA70DRAFT_1242412 [Coprinopsis sp. MPI-PUGE-AT-0042]|nr:hypothetical protein BKA70DRAFT_1242412 [Coprinopsis sp. MPI-PUGE-AT-0042]